MDWIELLWPSFCGGVIAGLWIVARNRRKAVDRVLEHLCKPWKPDDAYVCRKVLDDIKAVGWLPGWSTGEGPQKQDATGRVIARSVERVTKGDG